MVIKIPQRHIFPETLRKKISDKTGCSLPDWEISVPRKDDIAWSVVLSYLTSTNYKEREDFQRRLNLLTGNEKNIKSVKKSIEYFNPFRNRYACFHNEALKTVVNDFKKHLNWNNLLSVNDKLTAVSKTLDCPVVLIRDCEEFQNFTRSHRRSHDLIALFAFTFADSEDENSKVTVFNFLIGCQIGFKMRKAALSYYLKESELSKKEIKQLNTIDDSNNSFLIALLKSNHGHIVMKLYQDPYVISKLSDATYDMDPRTKDSGGLSALYYALVFNHSDTSVLTKLYVFASNNCRKNEGSYRNPDFDIMPNLYYMEELLSSDMSNLETNRKYPMNQDLKIDFCHLIKFNKFLIEVCSKILNAKSMLNYYESINENLFEASKRRDVIVVLLEAYNKFFYWVEHEVPMQISLDDYISNRNYYSIIDMVTVLFFFDNIVFLKEKLKLENENQFSEIESCFFISIFYIVLFQQANILENVKTVISKLVSIDLKSFYLLPLVKRDSTLKKLNNFSEILRNTEINENNVVKYIPENVIFSTLCSHPVLKDSIEMERLKQYMKIGINVKVTDEISVLVIERVLQVVGECIELTKKDLSFKRLLYLCLPKDISRELRQLRNDLSHLKGHAFSSKFECEDERNLSLFRSIQSEMRQIESHFKLFYCIMKLNVAMYSFEQLEDELKIAKDSIHKYAAIDMIPLDVLECVMLHLKRNSCNFLLQHVSSCQCFLKIALKNLEDEVKEEYLSSVNKDPMDVKDQILYILKPLEW